MYKILILGGGFGGIRCALDLSRFLSRKNFGIKKSRILDFVSPTKSETKSGSKNFEITLIDKKNYHLFAPALYEVASAYGVNPPFPTVPSRSSGGDSFAVRLKKTVCIPYSDIFSASGGGKINFIQAEIFSIDLENKKVATRGGEILDYDYLVIALGSEAADFGILGVKEYAFQLKNLEDALLLNQKMEELIKEIAAGQRPRPIKITVVGAGFTGIEVAAEFACCVKKFARVCGIKGRCDRAILLEAGPRILPAVSDCERNIILKRLTQLGIEVLENVAAEEIGGNYIKLKNGKRLDADLVIWTAGVRLPNLLEKTLILPLTGKKKIKVNNNLEVTGLLNVFAIGDNIEFIDSKTSKPLPALAYVAVDQGKIAAKNISRSIDHKKLVEYNPFYSVWIAPVGGKYALAHLWGEINIKGFWGWIIREAVDFKYMLSILPVKRAITIMWQEFTLFTKND